MKNKELYKDTEVGRIPVDWEVRRLGEIFEFLPSGTSPRSDLIEEGNVKYIHYGDIHTKWNSILNCKTSEIPYIKENKVKNLPRLKEGDLIMVDASEDYDGIGKSVEVVNVGEQQIVAGLHTILLRGNKDIIADGFKGYIQYIKPVKDTLYNIATGISVYGISKKDLSKILIPLPPLPEQKAIAKVLSDMDELIESIEKLIHKKKQIKEGAMQELLTGKKRLAGFSGEWEVKRLGNFLKFQVGYPFNSKYFNQDNLGIRLIKNRDLKSDEQLFYYTGKYSEEYLVNNGDVLVGMDGEFIPCLWNKGLGLLNQRVGRIITGEEIDLEFVHYFLIEPLKKIQNTTSGTTVKHLSHSDVENLELPLPPLPEQKAIAQILSDMDAEIEALEKKLDKYRKIKEGMMEKLLTGQVRLV